MKNLFKSIEVINLTHSRPIWTRTGEKRYHWKKVDHVSTKALPKKNAHLLKIWRTTSLRPFELSFTYWKFGTALRFKNAFIHLPSFSNFCIFQIPLQEEVQRALAPRSQEFIFLHQFHLQRIHIVIETSCLVCFSSPKVFYKPQFIFEGSQCFCR